MPDTSSVLPEGISRADFDQIKANILQWKFGSAAGASQINALNEFSEHNAACVNLHNRESGVYLQWEKQTLGINLGWTDHADADTATRTARWFLRRESADTAPVKYGERLALGYGTKPSFYHYEHRQVGINLGNVAAPAYEWIIIGGALGSPVKVGEMVGIYNVNVETDAGSGDFMVRHYRDNAGNIGWTSSPNGNHVYPLLKKYGPSVLKALKTVLVA